ncbi:nucleotidyltransferase domain-containing protein [Candidatus Leptofilum sp.]|uniref:nucleotidyltransferase domain-containing protein n=1 Tax=Candidatus Leptofilum sp. TaxID=3241576 RepID=UPI003B59D7D6
MKTKSESLLELARQNTAVFQQNPHIKAILVTGSVAKGLADDNSDIDIIVYYDTLPSEETFEAYRQAALDSGGGFYGGNAQDGFALFQYIGGIRHDFAHGRVSETENMVGQFLAEPSLEENNLFIALDGILTGLPLKGAEITDSWKTKLANYPPELSDLLVKKHLRFRPHWVLQKMGVDRNEVIFLQEELLNAVQNIFGVLCGLNQMYHPGKIKGLNYTVAQMQLAPSNVANRLPALFEVDMQTAVSNLKTLIEETVKLVEIHLPHIDTAPTWKLFNMQLRK